MKEAEEGEIQTTVAVTITIKAEVEDGINNPINLRLSVIDVTSSVIIVPNVTLSCHMTKK